jgi:chromosome segregation ATPase
VIKELQQWLTRHDRELCQVAEENGRARAEQDSRIDGLQEAIGGVAQLNQRIEVLEQENRRLSEANEVMKREIGEVSNCCSKVTKLERDLATLKEEIKAIQGKQVPLMKEVGQLKEAIQQMTAKMRNQFPPSVKKEGQFDVPEGIRKPKRYETEREAEGKTKSNM